jgi:translation initiation factor 4B
MSFETDEEALKSFFSGQAPLTARIMKDPQGTNKGYGYVEFPSGDSLREAVAMSGSNLGGRNIRVSVAEPRTSTLLRPLFLFPLSRVEIVKYLF